MAVGSIHSVCVLAVPSYQSTSMEGGVVVNGMSEHARDKENANSAILVQVHTDDFDDDPMKGIAYQETLEKKLTKSLVQLMKHLPNLSKIF